MQERDNERAKVLWREYIDGSQLDRMYYTAIGTRDQSHGFWVSVYFEDNELVIELERELAAEQVSPGVYYYIPGLDEHEYAALYDHLDTISILAEISETISGLWLTDND